MTTRYRTLYRLGCWGSVEARCQTMPDLEFDHFIHHVVTFVLINKRGACIRVDTLLITGWPDRAEVFDTDDETFPSLAAAIRAHAGRLVEVTEIPGLWQDEPARYDTSGGTVATAFKVGCG